MRSSPQRAPCLKTASLPRRLRERHRFAFVDDAQELTDAQVQLLRAIFGEALAGVTLCGDPASAVSMVRRTAARADLRAMQLARHAPRGRTGRRAIDVNRPKTALRGSGVRRRTRGRVDRAGRKRAADRRDLSFRARRRDLRNERCSTPTFPSRSPVTSISLRTAGSATRWRSCGTSTIRFVTNGSCGRFPDRAVGLSDASLATLCGEPLDPQRPLFAFDDEPAPTARASRWNPKRDLRLGWNVIRGEQDAALGAGAAARVQRFRRLREEWVEVMQSRPFEAFARRVWREGLARDGEPDSARALAQQAVLQRLLDRLHAFLAEKPDATTAEVLEYAQQRMESDLETCEPPARVRRASSR